MSTIIFFFFNDTATTEIYTLSLHDALPIWFLIISNRSQKYEQTKAEAAKKIKNKRAFAKFTGSYKKSM